ncbi:glycosyltransferase [candidate division CSSED10-310 bacterium]|uniref:Glycosyltransferase n=1 Tax=candidate division CSSED10-310 bacterium TaxID=2855610 RepID=A0ABV6YZX8_UNCC1
MTQAIHQILKTLVPGDAISHHTREIRDIIRSMGFQSEIFVETCDPTLVKETQPLESYDHYSSPENIVIFHFSQGTPLVDRILALPDRIVIIYHNITPEKYFRRVHHQTWESLIQGRDQLPLLASKSIFGFADSEYNRKELVQAGCRRTGVLPIIINFELYDEPLNPMVTHLFQDRQTTFLFVGRVTPNKGHLNILKFMYYFKKIEQAARLIIVGQYYGFEPYVYLLNQTTTHLKLEDVYFVGHVSHNELCTYYQLADIFLCVSFHEGFCVPLVESMYFDLPIMACSGTAIDDTLGNAGLIFKEFNPLLMAETAHRVLKDQAFRATIIRDQRRRCQHFERQKIVDIFKRHLQSIL